MNTTSITASVAISILLCLLAVGCEKEETAPPPTPEEAACSNIESKIDALEIDEAPGMTGPECERQMRFLGVSCRNGSEVLECFATAAPDSRDAFSTEFVACRDLCELKR